MDARRRRARGGRVMIAVTMAMLIASFFRVQILDGARWKFRAKANYLRQIPVPAPRGTVYDRNGQILADNAVGYTVTILPGPPDSVRAALDRLATPLGLSAERSAGVLAEMRRFGREVVVDDDAGFGAVSAVSERAWEFPGVVVEMRPRRRYRGSAAAHVLGYVGRITQEELDAETDASVRHRSSAVVGKDGVELRYEPALRGTEGVRYVEVDSRGRVVGDFAGGAAVSPRPGGDLHLNLDIELQEWIARIFPDTLSGAVVVLDPADGGVLALYSSPTYDPNVFVGGVSGPVWESLASDPGMPLFNRAVQGLYAPASTWKLAAAAIALDLGAVTPEETMPEPCRGYFIWGGRTWRCWKRDGHGFNNLAEAIGNSCDVYFYQLGLRVGLDRLLTGAIALGFGDVTGVDLPNESRGIFPADRSYWLERYGYTAREGEVLSLAIGQGPNSQTPLRMAQFYEALARGGEAPPPAIVRGADLGPGWSLDLEPKDLEALLEGLRRVTGPGGTAHMDATLEHWEVLGKTGTGQNAASLAGRGENDAWFAGMAGPIGGTPEVVVVALLEEGGSGSTVAAPLAAKAADFYLRRKHGIPVDTVQTLREWIAARGWPDWYRQRYGTHGT